MTLVREIHLSGTLAARPAASTYNDGYYYTATNENGGTTYRSNGSTWVQIAGSVTPAALALGDIPVELTVHQVTLFEAGTLTAGEIAYFVVNNTGYTWHILSTHLALRTPTGPIGETMYFDIKNTGNSIFQGDPNKLQLLADSSVAVGGTLNAYADVADGQRLTVNVDNVPVGSTAADMCVTVVYEY